MSIVLSARQAEDANRDLAKIARTGTSGLMLVPVEARGAVSGSTRTPRIHLSKAGEFLAKPVPTPGAGPSSGAPRQRISSVPGQRRPREDAASSRPAPPVVQGLATSVTQQRSKRPKSMSGPPRGGVDPSEKNKALVPCRRYLNELMRHQLAGPFLKPVDPLLVPGYYDVIKDVIDLGTIKKRLEGNQYEDIEEFESEVKRVWGNCYKFNQGVNDDIVQMAKKLEEVFDEKMASVPRDGDGGEASEQMKKMRREMMVMQKQMHEQQKLMKQQSELQHHSMQLQQYAAPPVTKRQSTGGGGRRNSSAGATAQQSALAALEQSVQQQDETADMTFEQKASLGGGINRLTSNNLAKVVQLIRENMPSLGAGQEEIEVDINALDNRTLWKLHNFVQSCNATKKRAPKRPAETADSRARSIAQAQADTAQQLTQADAGLRAYDQPSGPQGIALQQQDDNDSPADSDSDSEDDGAASLPPPANANGGGGGSGQWADFQHAKKQREREQLEKNAQAARANERAQHQAGHLQRERDAQRAAERARHDSEDGNLNLLGQSNMMASFTEGGGEGDGLDFQLDEYGGGM